MVVFFQFLTEIRFPGILSLERALLGFMVFIASEISSSLIFITSSLFLRQHGELLLDSEKAIRYLFAMIESITDFSVMISFDVGSIISLIVLELDFSFRF